MRCNLCLSAELFCLAVFALRLDWIVMGNGGARVREDAIKYKTGKRGAAGDRWWCAGCASGSPVGSGGVKFGICFLNILSYPIPLPKQNPKFPFHASSHRRSFLILATRQIETPLFFIHRIIKKLLYYYYYSAEKLLEH